MAHIIELCDKLVSGRRRHGNILAPQKGEDRLEWRRNGALFPNPLAYQQMEINLAVEVKVKKKNPTKTRCLKNRTQFAVLS